MRLFSKLREKLAYWFSMREISTYQQASQLKNLLEQEQLAKLCSALFTLLNSEQSFISNMVSCQDLKRQIAEQELLKAKYEVLVSQRNLLPHRYLGVTLNHDGVSWVVTFGHGESMLVGRGENPQAALTDFDSQWIGMKE